LDSQHPVRLKEASSISGRHGAPDWSSLQHDLVRGMPSLSSSSIQLPSAAGGTWTRASAKYLDALPVWGGT
jgi:hypothetical protein